MKLILSCTDAVSTLDDIEFDRLPFTIGRGDEADVCVPDSWASRVHCRLLIQDGEIRVQDLDSSNGTQVNGEKIDDLTLQSGDHLTVGITTFRVTFSARHATEAAHQAAREVVSI